MACCFITAWLQVRPKTTREINKHNHALSWLCFSERLIAEHARVIESLAMGYSVLEMDFANDIAINSRTEH